MMLMYIFFSCRNDHLDNNKKKSSTPYICESEENSGSLDSEFEPQTYDWNGNWSHFSIPQKTNKIYTYPHSEGILLSTHTVYDFMERHKNDSHLYWWGHDCFGEFTYSDIQDCTSKSFDQTCVIETRDDFFGHVIFLEHSSDSIENVTFSNALYQIPEFPVPISRVKDNNQDIYFQNRQDVFDGNFEPILSQSTNRYILDFLPTNDGIIVSQLQPQLEIQHLKRGSDSFEITESISVSKPLQDQQWTIWNNHLLSLQETNTLHLSPIQSLLTTTEVPLHTEFKQICSNNRVWAVTTDNTLIRFSINVSSYELTEEEVYTLQLDAQNYQLHCSSNALYLYDKMHHVLHRLHTE